MSLPSDIIARINHDFVHDSPGAIVARLEELSATKPATFSESRIIRCLIFAADGSRQKLESAILMAYIDPRDLILSAEYELDETNQKCTRLRDFGKPFSN